MESGDKKSSDGLFRNDEPTAEDKLGREHYARALARLALTCEQPMVIGVYGGWGTGKTSLMMQIRDVLRQNGQADTIWFDPWQHQFDEEPLLALLQTMVVQLGKQTEKDIKRLLTTIGFAIGSGIIRKGLGISFEDIRKINQYTAEEQFELRSLQIRIKEEIEGLLARSRSDDRRLVFFIDDLDRCLPKHILRMLESLKLYLNVTGCVYFLGLDYAVIKRSIAKENVDLASYDRDYLEKIIQVPFQIPPIHEQASMPFIESLLPDKARQCAEYIAPIIGRNPRQVKRFVNNFGLHLSLAQEVMGEDCSVELVAALLLIQHRNEGLFDRISLRPQLYAELASAADNGADLGTEDAFGGDMQLQRIVEKLPPPQGAALDRYVHLADIAGASLRDAGASAIEPETVTIEPGEFQMGSGEFDREKPPHTVTIGYRFAVGRYPVTFAEYDRYVEATGAKLPDDEGWGRERRPVINVSWEDAQAYAAWLSQETGKPYRLLSEAEWEYACRAGTTTRYSWGDDITPERANYRDSGHGKTTPVGSYPANPWGLYDMHGNVWEWVEDLWHESYKGAPDDGRAWTTGDSGARVLRGGSWHYDPAVLRSAYRVRYTPVNRGYDAGFRVARTLTP